MHQHFLKICGLFLVALGLGYGQMFAQNPDWPLVPNLQHFSSSGNTPSVMAGSYPTPYYASNSAQDASGNLMFYVVNEKIYDNAGNLIGNAGQYGNGKDILILPDPNDCEARLILTGYCQIATPLATSGYYHWFLDATRVKKTGTIWSVQPSGFSTIFGGNDNFYMSMALSQPNSNGERFWYVVTSGGVHQYKIDKTGINFSGSISFGYVAEPTDAEVSPTGDRLAWTDVSNNNTLRWANLNASGGFLSQGSSSLTPLGTYKSYGLEFVDNTNVLVAAVRTSASGPVSGIYKKNLASSLPATQLLANPAYAESQLEKAADGKIYAASAAGLWGIDPVTNTTASIAGAVHSNKFASISLLYYALPKQLDYENYPKVFGCPCPQFVNITGSYAVPLTESQTWIKSNGVCTIPAGTTVKLDADPSSGYVELNPGFLADWRTGGSVFIAQAFNGCTAGAPLRPSIVERNADSDARPTVVAPSQSAIVFPNPTNGDFTLEFNEAFPSETLVVVLDLTGRTVFQALVPEGTLRQTCSLGNAPSGMYVVRALCEGKPVWTGKVLKEE